MYKKTIHYETADLTPRRSQSPGTLPDINDICMNYAKLYHYCVSNGIEPPVIDIDDEFKDMPKSIQEIERIIENMEKKNSDK